MSDETEQYKNIAQADPHISKWSPYGEEVQSVHNCVERQEKKKKDFQLLLVVGKYRIWVFLKEKKMKLKMVREFHLYDLESLNRSNDQVTISYKSPSKSNKFSVSCSTAGAMIKGIRESFAIIASGFPATYFQLEDSGAVAVDPYEADPATKFINNYYGQCSFYGVLANREVVFYLRDLIDNNVTELDITQIPVIEDDADKAPLLELRALVASLRYDSHFRSVICTDTPQPAVMSMVAYVLQTNVTLTKVVLSDIGASEQQIIEVAEALKKNSLHAVQILDLSGNNISPKAALELAKVFHSYRHPLIELDLSNCSMQPRAIQLIFSAFIENPSVSLSLQVLNLSNNKFELPGSLELERWFFALKVYAKIRHLLLSGCTLSLNVLQSLKHMTEIAELDISNNRLVDGNSTFVLSAFLEVSPSITNLNLSGCGISYDAGAKSLFTALSRNPKASNCTVNFSENTELKMQIHKDLVQAASKIASLDLTGIKTKDATWIEMVQTVGKLNMLHTLNLSDTLSRSGPQGPIIQALSGLLQSCPTITTLKLGSCFGKRVLIPFFDSWNDTVSLTSIDISNNNMGDSGAAAVANMLTHNRRLQFLDMDKNLTKTNGFTALSSAFIHNKTVGVMNYSEDAQRELAALQGKSKERLAMVLESIHRALQRNSPQEVGFWHTGKPRHWRSCPTPMEILPFPPMPVHLQGQNTALSINDTAAVTATVAAVSTAASGGTLRSTPGTLRAPPPLAPREHEPAPPPPPPRLVIPTTKPKTPKVEEPEPEPEAEPGTEETGPFTGGGDGGESSDDGGYASD
ncbi:F-actin-uncapping protein LRRC16A [Pelomyxa schiedti]|nr:F-actin-uncapping protein LRRC16A [Pelomyxa schiedti]